MDLVGETSESMIRLLPVMRTDIFLRMGEKVLIIDANYYNSTMQKKYDKYTLHSANIYQIFTYVKNQDKDNTRNVAGLLLYAKTDEALTPDCEFNIGGNWIGARTVDLNVEFEGIAGLLDRVVEELIRSFRRTDELLFISMEIMPVV